MTTATTQTAAGAPVRSEALLACRCGREPEHGYDSHGHFYWRGCEACGIYVSAVTSFGLLRRWRERQQDSTGDWCGRFRCWAGDDPQNLEVDVDVDAHKAPADMPGAEPKEIERKWYWVMPNKENIGKGAV